MSGRARGIGRCRAGWRGRWRWCRRWVTLVWRRRCGWLLLAGCRWGRVSCWAARCRRRYGVWGGLRRWSIRAGGGGLVDLPPSLDERAAARLCTVLAGAGGEDQVAVRGSGVFARRLARAPLAGPPQRTWQPRGTVLVTGGTGGL